MLKYTEHNRKIKTKNITEPVICSNVLKKLENSILDLRIGTESMRVRALSSGSKNSVRFASIKKASEYIKLLLCLLFGFIFF